MKNCDDVEFPYFPITDFTSNTPSCSLIDYKKDGVDVFTPSHALLATKVIFSSNFEKHTTRIGSRLLNKIGYTGGVIGKNGKSIDVPITPKMRSPRVYLGYDEDTLSNK